MQKRQAPPPQTLCAFEILDAKPIKPNGTPISTETQTFTSEQVKAHHKELAQYVFKTHPEGELTIAERIKTLPPNTQLPEEYCCPISADIMTCPVKANTISFDFLSIAEWLTKKGEKATNPCNLKKLTICDIVPDQQTLDNINNCLKHNIDEENQAELQPQETKAVLKATRKEPTNTNQTDQCCRLFLQWHKRKARVPEANNTADAQPGCRLS